MLFNPSVTETFGNVTLETMACGIPVIAAHATGSESLVQNGVTGQLVPPGDIAAYADALARYCTDAALRQAHGAAGAKASSAYDWDSVNQAVLDQYQRMSLHRRVPHG
jgi:glycosyltransferase involved in cell wall biosynthesis